MITHCVYFTLHKKDPETLTAFIEDTKSFGKNIAELKLIEVGTLMPGCQREIQDKEFDVAIVSFFDDQAALNAYMVHPDHNDYVDRNVANWKKIRVFDAKSN